MPFKNGKYVEADREGNLNVTVNVKPSPMLVEYCTTFLNRVLWRSTLLTCTKTNLNARDHEAMLEAMEIVEQSLGEAGYYHR